MQKKLRETYILGEHTVQRCVRSGLDDDRDWLADQPVCDSLLDFQIQHAGIMKANYPYEVIRTHQSGAFFLATTKGEGRVLINGEWSICENGKACLLPAYTANALHCMEGREWEFCWVRYQHPPEQIPLISSVVPIMEPFNVNQLQMAVHGLIFAAEKEGHRAITQQWARLIHTYVQEFTDPYRSDDRLWHLWTAVDQNLADDWSLQSMAKVACLSGEHLRRLCKSQHGRSPVQQIRWLRMQRSAELLVMTDDKIEAIAYDVGYKNAAVFTAAFHRQFDQTPSQYRSLQLEARG